MPGLKLVTEDAVFLCSHSTGRATPGARQAWVTVQGRRLCVEGDPVGRTITACNNANPQAGQVPCASTRTVATGYSTLLFIDGAPACLQTLYGTALGTTVPIPTWSVEVIGQDLVTEGP